MEVKEAILKIEEIHSVIQSSNKALFSGRHMTLYGIMVLLIPVIGTITRWLTFGFDFGNYQTMYTAVANTLFFWGLSVLIGKLIPRSSYYREKKEHLHPLIKKAFSLTNPIVASIFGVVIILSLAGQSQFIYPFVLVLLGVMFSVFGRFTIPVVSYIAWTYIFCGLLHFYLLQFNIPYLSFYFLVYNGLTYILMGSFLSRAERAYDE